MYFQKLTIFLVLCSLFAFGKSHSYEGNYALSFDGVDDIVKIGHSFTDNSLTEFWTLEAWIKPYGNQSNQRQPNIIGFPSRHPNLELCGDGVYNPTLCTSPTQTITQLREKNGQYFTIVGTQSLAHTTSTWYHLAGTWDNKTLNLYVNGEIDRSINPYSEGYIEGRNCTYSLCDEGLDIGGFRWLSEEGKIVSHQYFSGIIDEVRVWKVGRTQKQIKETMYTTLLGDEEGLLYYWDFDEGSGTLVSSLAKESYGTLGGGIRETQPKWVRSDCPIENAQPFIYRTNYSVVYVVSSMMSFLLFCFGVIFGAAIFTRCFKRDSGAQPV